MLSKAKMCMYRDDVRIPETLTGPNPTMRPRNVSALPYHLQNASSLIDIDYWADVVDSLRKKGEPFRKGLIRMHHNTDR